MLAPVAVALVLTVLMNYVNGNRDPTAMLGFGSFVGLARDGHVGGAGRGPERAAEGEWRAGGWATIRGRATRSELAGARVGRPPPVACLGGGGSGGGTRSEGEWRFSRGITTTSHQSLS